MTDSTSGDRYVPAAGIAALTRFYDPVMALTMREGHWRPRLIDEVSRELPEESTVVDVGAGTGTFALALRDRRPDLRVVAVDGDRKALDIARGKPGAGPVEWTEALAGDLPLEDDAADALTISLLLHHLDPDAKRAALDEARRVLAPGGTLHVADWGRPSDPFVGAGFFAIRVLDGFSNTRDHAEGRIPALIEAAGFSEPRVWERLRTPFGSLELISAG